MSLVVALFLCFMTANNANNKGYNGFLWFLGGGPLGLLIVAFLPDLKKEGLLPEDIEKKKKIGDGIGIGLSVLALFLIVALAANS